MGYETKMFICQLSDFVDRDGLTYAMPIGMVDLCKTGQGFVSKLIRKQTTEEPVVYFFGSDGNTRVIMDAYDEALGVISLPDMVEALKNDDLSYRRFKLALALLEATKGEFNNLYVVTLGY